MQVLFVHGMGRSPLSAWFLLRQLKNADLKTFTFGYMVSLEDFASIRKRLIAKISGLAAGGEYVLIGHSLGGVVLRAALNAMPPGTLPPHHVFLLGSPVHFSRLAKKLEKNLIFRALTRDCGQLLGLSARMSEVAQLPYPTTSIVGIRGLRWMRRLFGSELNDGVVSLSEVSAHWIVDQIQVPIIHTVLPSSKCVAQIILQRLGRSK